MFITIGNIKYIFRLPTQQVPFNGYKRSVNFLVVSIILLLYISLTCKDSETMFRSIDLIYPKKVITEQIIRTNVNS